MQHGVGGCDESTCRRVAVTCSSWCQRVPSTCQRAHEVMALNREHTVTAAPDLLPPAEAAALFASVATLRYWRSLRGGLASFRLGRRVVSWRGDVTLPPSAARPLRDGGPDAHPESGTTRNDCQQSSPLLPLMILRRTALRRPVAGLRPGPLTVLIRDAGTRSVLIRRCNTTRSPAVTPSSPGRHRIRKPGLPHADSPPRSWRTQVRNRCR
jgi:hypothetical protein